MHNELINRIDRPKPYHRRRLQDAAKTAAEAYMQGTRYGERLCIAYIGQSAHRLVLVYSLLKHADRLGTHATRLMGELGYRLDADTTF